MRSVSALLAQLERLQETSDHPPLLFVPQLTPSVIRRLTDEGIEFVDGAGNLHIDSPAAYALVTSKRPQEIRRGRGFTACDLEVAFALLAQPRLRLATYRRLNRVTGLSLGKISQSVRKMEAVRYVHRSRRGGAQLRDAHALMERWEFGYLEQLRPRLNPTYYEFNDDGPAKSARDSLEAVASAASKVHGVLVGGEVAARFLRDEQGSKAHEPQLTLHAPSVRIDALIRKLGLRPTKERTGLTIIERFARKQAHPREIELDALPGDNPLRLANPLLVRAELLAQDSARLRTAATELFEEHIERTLGPGFRQRPVRETTGGDRQ